MLLDEGWSANRQAAKAVALHAGGTPSERRELLDMLGLIGDDGRIAPDAPPVTDVGALHNISADDDQKNLTYYRQERPAAVELLPEGLRRHREEIAADPDAGKRLRQPKPDYTPNRYGQRSPRPVRVPSPHVRQPARCGTRQGAVRHRRLGQKVCEECRRAECDYRNERNKITRGRPVKHRQPVQCGTPQGRKKHVRDHTPICEPCKEAYNKANRDRYHARKAELKASGEWNRPPTHDPERCGTTRGVKRHQRAGEKQCDACREVGNAAKRAQWRASYYRKKAAAEATVAQEQAQAS